MFGYVKPDAPYLFIKDDTLYKGLYCGVCKSIGATCGQMARLTLTYDITFLSAILHNITGVDVKLKKSRCVTHFITTKQMAERDELTDTLAMLNVLLAYHKIEDDVLDSGKGKTKKALLSAAYKKARSKLPVLDEIIVKRYGELFELEKLSCSSIDQVSEPFALMLADICDYLLGDKKTEYTTRLFYNVGKWIYLIDALDDYDKDIKENNYNVLYLAYGAENAKKLLSEHGGDIAFTFKWLFTQMAECVNEIKFYFNADLVKNIIQRGLPVATDNVVAKINKDVRR